MIKGMVQRTLFGERLSETIILSGVATVSALVYTVYTDTGLLLHYNSFLNQYIQLLRGFPTIEFAPLIVLFLLSIYLGFSKRGWFTCVAVVAAGWYILHRSSYYFIGSGFFSSGIGAAIRGYIMAGLWFGTISFLIGYGLHYLKNKWQERERRSNTPLLNR